MERMIKLMGLSDWLFLIGLAALFAGLWMVSGLGWALIAGGAILLALSVASAWRSSAAPREVK